MADPALIPWLTLQMENPELARPAGESFTMITGVDMAGENLESEKPVGFETGPTDNPEEEDVAPDPDEDLPSSPQNRTSASTCGCCIGTGYLESGPTTV